MKKALLLGAIATIFFGSCGSGANLKSDIDSLSYAVGVNMAYSLHNADSVMRIQVDIDQIYAAMKDFQKNRSDSVMTFAQANEFIQIFMGKQEYRNFVEDSTKNAEATTAYLEKIAADESFTKTESGIYYKIVEAGTGDNADLNDTLKVHYKLTLGNGEAKDSTTGREPMRFVNRRGAMVEGFTEAMSFLNKGAKAVVVIPPEKGYGRSHSPVGPAHTLIFDVEMVDVIKPVEKK